MFLTDAETARIVDLGFLFLQCFVFLADRALKDLRPRWKGRPKLHSFHCETLCRLKSGSRLNPRFYSCWLDEDFVGRTCSMGKRAVHTQTLAKRVLQRCLLQINVHLQEKQEK